MENAGFLHLKNAFFGVMCQKDIKFKTDVFSVGKKVRKVDFFSLAVSLVVVSVGCWYLGAETRKRG